MKRPPPSPTPADDGAVAPRRGRGGFSLVELLLVVVVMSIMAGSVAVSLSGRQDPYALRAGADELAAAITYASAAARTERRRHRVSFTTDLQSYRVEAEGSERGEFVPAEGLAGLPKPLPQGVSVKQLVRDDGAEADPASAVEFGPDGSGFSGRIDVEGRRQLRLRIRVVGETGQALVEK